MNALILLQKHTGRSSKALFKHLISAVLCICMIMASLIGAGVLFSNPLTTHAFTSDAVVRSADPSTMDTYRAELDLSTSTRDAGKLWSDKTVFAYGQSYTDKLSRSFSGTSLQLSRDLDGIEGQIDLDADFLHVYSVMGSSQGWRGVPPVRAVIVFDNSGSMYNNNKSSGKWDDQRIAITIEAINRAIDALMEASAYNEVSVVLFGDGSNAGQSDSSSTHPYNGNNTAVTIMPMAHYEQSKGEGGYTHYLSGGWSQTFNGASPDHTKIAGGGWVFVNNQITGLIQGGDKGYADGYQNCGNNNFTAYRNGTTNIQAGYAIGMRELLNATKTQKVGKRIYNCVPALVILTDGAATDMLKGTFSGVYNQADSFGLISRGYSNDPGNKLRSFIGYNKVDTKEVYNVWDMFVRKSNKDGQDYYQMVGGAYGAQRSTAPTGVNKDNMISLANDYKNTQSAMLLNTLMTAAYGKVAVKQAYNGNECSIYTLSVDMLNPDTIPDNGIVKESDGILPKNGYIITTSPSTMNPNLYFNNTWLQQKGYFKGDVPRGGEGADNNTTYPDYSFGSLVIQSIGDAQTQLQKWARGEAVTDSYIPWAEVQNIVKDMKNGIMGDGGTTLSGTAEEPKNNGHGNGYLIEDVQPISYPQLTGAVTADNPYGLTNQDIVDNINYVTAAYYVSTGTAGADTVENAFASIVEQINTPVYEPVQGSNDLGVTNSVTYMDPLGKYMEVKEVKKLLLFGELYDVVPSAVYDYQFNDAWMQAYKPSEAGESVFPEGWYYGGDPLDERNKYGPQTSLGYESDGGSYPQVDGIKSSAEAWSKGWKYRLNYKTAQQYVPSLSATDAGTIGEKQQKTSYSFYRLGLPAKERGQLRINPEYGAKLPEGVTLDNYESFPGVYKLSDIRIWVEDSEDYNDTLVDSTGGVLSDANFDRALWVDIPVSALPVRAVIIDIRNGSIESCNYTTNLTSSDAGYAASFPLRIFYTVGVESDLLSADNHIDIAKVSSEYIKNNKIASAAAKTVRDLELNDVEFFSNWYNPENRYNAYAISETDYSYGDPVVTFSPSGDNSYYIFEKALPLYSTAYVWAPLSGTTSERDKVVAQNGGIWKKVRLKEDLNKDEDHEAQVFDPRDFDGRLLAGDLEPKEVDPNAATDEARRLNQVHMWEALNEKGISSAEPGDVILLKTHRLSNVDYPSDPAAADPFSSDGYFYLLQDYYKLDEKGIATQVHHVLARKGSEFGSAYEASGITNGDMLCWYDASGTYEQVYPYLSYKETSDSTRGRYYIGMPLDEHGKYRNSDEHGKPAEEPGADALEIQSTGEWVIAAKPGGLQVGSLAQTIGEKTLGPDGDDYIGGEKNPNYQDYIAERFPNAPSGFTVGYYTGNTTRTANNYCLPTISTSSSVTKNDVIVNTYLGNNGRLVVNDTTLLLTKMVVSPVGMPTDVGRNFDFQAYVDGWSGSRDAVVMTYNETSGIWQRQLHYIDLELDGKLFLQNTDGTKVLADSDGCRLYQDGYNPETNAPVYKYIEDCTVQTDAGSLAHIKDELYTKNDGPYYVFIGTNTFSDSSSDEGIGSNDTAFRVYHNYLHNGGAMVDEKDVTCEHFDIEGNPVDSQFDQNYIGQSNFYATCAWLFTIAQYEDFTLNGSWEKEDGSPNYLPSEGLGEPRKVSRFFLLTLEPDEGTGQGQRIRSEYLTQSAFLTQTVYFGYKADVAQWLESNPDKTLAETPLQYRLTQKELYDCRVDTGSAAKPENTAEFTLQHGFGLLFAGIKRDTNYILTENITDADAQDGYSIVEVKQSVQADERTNITTSSDKRACSVAGDTGVTEETAHYTNTYTPDMLIVSKVMTGKDGTPVTEVDTQNSFTFTATFLLPKEDGNAARWLDEPVCYWSGRTSELETAPKPGDTEEVRKLKQLFVGRDRRTYTFTLKADESIVIYDLPMGTKYTVTEMRNENYPAQGDEGETVNKEVYIKSGEIIRSGELLKPSDDSSEYTENKVEFINIKPKPDTGTLAVEKKIDGDRPNGTDEFNFIVELQTKDGTALKVEEMDVYDIVKAEDGTETLTKKEVIWEEQKDAEDNVIKLTSSFKLQHGQKIIISGIPYGTVYKVTEPEAEGYKLQRVEDGNYPDDATKFFKINDTDNSVTGSLAKEQPLIFMLFVNGRIFHMPFMGGYGVWLFWGLGALALSLALLFFVLRIRKRRN